MNDRRLDEERVFHIARQLADMEARSDYLDQVCAGDANLRRRVEALLEVHEQEEMGRRWLRPHVTILALFRPGELDALRTRFGESLLCKSLIPNRLDVRRQTRSGSDPSGRGARSKVILTDRRRPHRIRLATIDDYGPFVFYVRRLIRSRRCWAAALMFSDNSGMARTAAKSEAALASSCTAEYARARL